MLKAAILGGLFIGILSALPVIKIFNCCCLWLLTGGAIAAYIAQQNDPSPMTVGRGAGVGALAGVIGAFVWIPAEMAMSAVMAPLQERFFAEMLRTARDMPPEARQWIDLMTSESGSAMRIAMGFVFQFCLGAIFASIGGMLSAAFFKKDVPPALGGPIAPPPIPPTPTDRW